MARRKNSSEELAMKKRIGENLAAIRSLTDFSQTAFAKSLGLKQAVYQKWESGGLFPNPVHVVKICAKAQCTFDFIYLRRFQGVPDEIADRLRSYFVLSQIR